MKTITMGTLDLKFLETREGTDGSLDFFEMTVRPQGRMPVPHYHESWDETIYGLTGTITFTLDGTPRDLHPGQSLFIKRGVVHGFDNTSDAPATCLCILTPGALGPTYFQELADVIGSGAPDPQKMKAIMLRHGLIPVAPSPG